MNKKQWKNNKISDSKFLAKLSEEFGEVGRAQVNRLNALAAKNPAKRGYKAHTKNLIEELEHVEFIARCWREKLIENAGQ